MRNIKVRKPLAVSLLFHAAILFWAVAVFPSTRDDALEPQPVAVEMVTPSEVTRVKGGERDAKERPKAEEKPEEPVKPQPRAKEEPKAQAVRAPEPQPKPSPEAAEPAPKKQAETREPPAPEKKAEAAPAPPAPSRKPRVAPKFTEPLKPSPEEEPERKVAARPKPKEKNFDADRIAALLDKSPDKAAPTTRSQPETETPGPEKPAPGQPQGRDLQMSISEIDALRARISQCWNPPVGGLGADALRVKLRLRLNEDGMLSGRPEVVNREASPFFEAAADSAVRAVMLCQPYTLPAEKYALWRDMILNFDPKEMLGG